MRGNACSVSSFICACVCCVCVSCVCVCPSLLEGVMMMDGGRKRDWSSCAQWELVWWSESPTFYVPYIHPLAQYQKHGMIEFYALAGNIHSFCWKRSFCKSILGVLCECLYASLSLFFFFFYISAFPCSLCSLWADSCVATVWFTDVGLYNETVPRFPPFSPCCEAVYIRLLSQVSPKVISLL